MAKNNPTTKSIIKAKVHRKGRHVKKINKHKSTKKYNQQGR